MVIFLVAPHMVALVQDLEVDLASRRRAVRCVGTTTALILGMEITLGNFFAERICIACKKSTHRLFQSKPSTLSNSRREETSSQSVFKVLVSDFPPEVTQALDKTASVGGTEDGVYSWAIKSDQIYVWNNLTRKVVHNAVNLPSLPSGLQHPANLILSTRKNGLTGANKLTLLPMLEIHMRTTIRYLWFPRLEL